MSNVKQKVSGCFRKREAYCRISKLPTDHGGNGRYNPFVAIQMALSGELYAADGAPGPSCEQSPSKSMTDRVFCSSVDPGRDRGIEVTFTPDRSKYAFP